MPSQKLRNTHWKSWKFQGATQR